jgi:hypothetical protein
VVSHAQERDRRPLQRVVGEFEARHVPPISLALPGVILPTAADTRKAKRSICG